MLKGLTNTRTKWHKVRHTLNNLFDSIDMCFNCLFRCHDQPAGCRYIKSKMVTVDRLVERPLCDRVVVGSTPDQVILKALKMVQVAFSFGAQH